MVWHTQGRGKGFSMLFFTARVMRHPAMRNPTLVVLTDRTDLDDELFREFQRCADLLDRKPVRAGGCELLRELLNRANGGVVFVTICKLMTEMGDALPELRRPQNTVISATQADRRQYEFGAR